MPPEGMGIVLDKIESKTLRQLAYDGISNAILSGSMKPGQRFSLRDLSRHLGVSTMPVREALWQLESEKVILIQSNKRMLVNTLDLRELEDVFALRIFLETELARRACETRDERTIERAQDIYRKIEACMSDVQQYVSCNKDFHFVIYEASDSKIFLDTVRSLWLRVAPYFTIQNENVSSHVQLQPHRRMLQSLISRDREEMTAALQTDLESAKAFIRGLLLS